MKMVKQILEENPNDANSSEYYIILFNFCLHSFLLVDFICYFEEKKRRECIYVFAFTHI